MKMRLSEAAHIELIDLVIEAILEAGAAEIASVGGRRRAESLSADERTAIARKAAKARWAWR